RQRRLHENAVVHRTPIQAIDERERIGQRRSLQQPLEIDAKTDLGAGLHLVANVDLRRRIVARQYDAQPGTAPVPRNERGHLRFELLLQPRRERLAVQDPCRHAAIISSSAFTLSVPPSTTSSSPPRITASGGGLNSMALSARLIATMITPNF